MADLLGSILSSMEKPPSLGDQETRRKAREQAARLKKLQEQEKQQKVEFRKRMEKEVSDFIQDSGQIKKKFQPMNKIERSILHDVVEVAGLTSFSFGEDDECRYVMIFKKEFAPSDEELESYRRGEEWDPQKAEEKRKLKVSYAGCPSRLAAYHLRGAGARPCTLLPYLCTPRSWPSSRRRRQPSRDLWW
ncbi:sperm-associated antigen 7 isoform X2 [Elephas maximus indicus]|uniref:sperm-associated antigen 7 isoform X2 n=1 Tax=Elephas maximus indicus TaxID=99487 RepID=UPI002116416E|nr:sperm-associated antigen 7 isoform X2 [Elephas maximus indicus]